MKTSVVMTTYNGSEYVVEQMESLRTQSQKIDEVLIFDDQSKDNTVDIVREYISRNNLSDWSIIVNEHNKGYRLNFLEGVMQATGDVIFYCDQDDIWENEKVKRITECFESNENVMVCGHDVTWFDQNGSGDYRVLNRGGGGTLEQYNFIQKLKRTADNGHALAMRRSFRDEVVPTMIQTEGMLFDEGLATVASFRGQYYILHAPLVRHRIHDHNNSTKHWTFRSRIRDIDRQIASREVKIKRIRVYISNFPDKISNQDRKTVDDFLKFAEKRVKYMKNKQLLRCIFQTFHYNPINDWKFLLVDILCIASNRKT